MACKIVGGGMYVANGTIFAQGFISRRKNRFLADFAAGAFTLKQNLEGVVVEGEILPLYSFYFSSYRSIYLAVSLG